MWFLLKFKHQHSATMTETNLFPEMMSIYPMTECIEDFMELHYDTSVQNDLNFYYIRNLLQIDKSLESIFCSIDNLQSVISSIDSEERHIAIYIVNIHCILCHIAQITNPLMSNTLSLESGALGIDENLKCILSSKSMDIEELRSNHGINLHHFDDAEKDAIRLLLKMNQHHIFRKWNVSGNVPETLSDENGKHRLLAQVQRLNANYPGGLWQYYSNARRLLAASSENINPYTGWTVHKPDLIHLDFDSAQFHEFEARGRTQFGQCGFVLLGGGFGERLGFNGIKTALPSEITTNTSFLELYIRTLLAFQQRARCDSGDQDLVLPFACTTSGKGHDLTVDFLEKNDYFGMDREQFTFLRQELVASFSNKRCDFAMKNRYVCCFGLSVMVKQNGMFSSVHQVRKNLTS